MSNHPTPDTSASGTYGGGVQSPQAILNPKDALAGFSPAFHQTRGDLAELLASPPLGSSFHSPIIPQPGV